MHFSQESYYVHENVKTFQLVFDGIFDPTFLLEGDLRLLFIQSSGQRKSIGRLEFPQIFFDFGEGNPSLRIEDQHSVEEVHPLRFAFDGWMVDFPASTLLLDTYKLADRLVGFSLALDYLLTGQHFIQDVASTVDIAFLVIIIASQDYFRGSVFLSAHHSGY